MFPLQEARVQSLVEELNPTCIPMQPKKTTARHIIIRLIETLLSFQEEPYYIMNREIVQVREQQSSISKLPKQKAINLGYYTQQK